MITLDLAMQLKEAGLTWHPALLDFFGLPDRQMDERIFVISDMLVTVDLLQGMQIVSFQGASEWALDYLVTTDVVWLPTEEQLRKALEAALLSTGRPELRLTSTLTGCRLDFAYGDGLRTFEADSASEAYAAGLLYLLKKGPVPGPSADEGNGPSFSQEN